MDRTWLGLWNLILWWTLLPANAGCLSTPASTADLALIDICEPPAAPLAWCYCVDEQPPGFIAVRRGESPGPELGACYEIAATPPACTTDYSCACLEAHHDAVCGVRDGWSTYPAACDATGHYLVVTCGVVS